MFLKLANFPFRLLSRYILSILAIVGRPLL